MMRNRADRSNDLDLRAPFDTWSMSGPCRHLSGVGMICMFENGLLDIEIADGIISRQCKPAMEISNMSQSCFTHIGVVTKEAILNRFLSHGIDTLFSLNQSILTDNILEVVKSHLSYPPTLLLSMTLRSIP